jgi:hypothetical protein
MKPGHAKAVVVVAVTTVEGADVRAEGEAVTGVEVVAEDATNNFLIIAVVPPLPVLRRMLLPRIQAAKRWPDVSRPVFGSKPPK